MLPFFLSVPAQAPPHVTCVSSQNCFAVTKQMPEPVQLKRWWRNSAVSAGEGKDLWLLFKLALLLKFLGLCWKAG